MKPWEKTTENNLGLFQLAHSDFEVPVLGTSGDQNGSELMVEIDNPWYQK